MAEFVDKPDLEEESCGRGAVEGSPERGAEAAGDNEEGAKDPEEHEDAGNNEEREESAEDAEMRRELFRQTKDAFLKRPVASFRHKVSHNSRRCVSY